MHTINDCPRCGKDFMYHQTDVHLFRELKLNEEIKNEYPIQDEQWASRRWNADRTESCDLSRGYDVICQDCDEIEKQIEDDLNDRELGKETLWIYESPDGGKTIYKREPLKIERAKIKK